MPTLLPPSPPDDQPAAPPSGWAALQQALALARAGDHAAADAALVDAGRCAGITAEVLSIVAAQIARLRARVICERPPLDTLDPAVWPGAPFRRRLHAKPLAGLPASFVLPEVPWGLHDPAPLHAAAPALPPGLGRSVASVHVMIEATAETDLADLCRALTGRFAPPGVTLSVFTPADRAASFPGPGVTLRHHFMPLLHPDARSAMAAAAEADLVVFLTGATRLDELFLMRASGLAALTDRLVMPLVPQMADTGPGAGFPALWAAGPTLSDPPFDALRGLNLALSGPMLRQIGPLDSRFEGSGWASREFAFRLLAAGCRFAPLPVPQVDAADFPTGPDADLCRALVPDPALRPRDQRHPVPRLSVCLVAAAIDAPLRTTITALCADTLQDMEIIVCLPADAVAEPEGPDDPRLRVIPADADTALVAATGLYVAWLEPGAVPDPGVLARHVAHLDAHPRLAATYEAHDGKPAQGEAAHAVLFAGRHRPVLAVMRRAAVAQGARVQPRMRSALLRDLLLQLAGRGPLQALPRSAPHPRRPAAEDPSDLRLARLDVLRHTRFQRDWQSDPGAPVRRRAHRPMVIFWPDYGRTNPYQSLLYAKARQTYEIIAAPIDTALAIATGPDHPAPPIFHLHWTNFLFRKATDEKMARRRADGFLDRLHRFRAAGGRLVWTVHNARSHDTPFQAIEQQLCARIAAMADIVHVHNASAADQLVRHFPVPQETVRISRHGHFLDAYPDRVSRLEARRALRLAPQDDVVAFIGQLRPYKGADNLIEAFRALRKLRPALKLIVAGADNEDRLTAGLTERDRAQILTSGRFLDPTDMQLALRAADAVALPYRDVLTSGAAILALGFGCPVVLPDLPGLRALVGPCEAGRLYDPDAGIPALVAALSDLLAIKDRGGLGALQAQAAELASTLAWPDFSAIFDAARETGAHAGSAATFPDDAPRAKA